MPFDFKKFDAKCACMSIDELQREWEHYTRLISGSATSTAVSGAAIPFTLGISVIGVGFAAPAIHNARKKREIIERYLQRLGTTHYTRKRDVLTPIAISGTVGLVTLGVGSAGAGAITNAAVEHGITSVAANEMAVKATVHLAVHSAAMVGEDHHMGKKRLAAAQNAQLKQQQEKEKLQNDANMNQFAVGIYDPSTYHYQPQTATNAGHTGDVKYEYNPVPISPPVTEPAPPPYSPSSHGGYQSYLPHPQGYSEPPDCNITATPYPADPSEFDAGMSYRAPTPEPTLNRPQPHPLQISASPATGTSAYGGTHQTLNTSIYSHPLVQPTPQLMYPSYPASVMPDSAHQQYGRLDQVMSELSISAISSPPQTHSDFATSRTQTTNLPIPTHRGYCSEPQHTSAQDNSYFPPPSPISPVSSVHYPQVTDHSCLSPISPHATPAVPFRSPSMSSMSSYTPYSHRQEQAASFNHHGYMTPMSTPSSQYDQAHSQRHDGIPDRCQTQVRPSRPSYVNGVLTPAQTPYYPNSPIPHNHLRSPLQQPSCFQPSHCQPSPQASIQGSWRDLQAHGDTCGPSYTNQGYPTPTATPSHITKQNEQPIYFPPPPTQSNK